MEPNQRKLTRREMLKLIGAGIGDAIFFGSLGYYFGKRDGQNLSQNTPTKPQLPTSLPTETSQVITETAIPTNTPTVKKKPEATPTPTVDQVSLPPAITPEDFQKMQPHLKDSHIIKSFGTMKDTRDRENDPPSDQEITALFTKAKEGGAKQVDICTPYDKEFRDDLVRYVKIAHDLGLNVILRGNFARTEGWYDNKIPKSEYYKSIEEHVAATGKFLDDILTKHPDLLGDGDWFDPAPEPENAKRIIGDYWNGNKDKFREYVQKLYQVSRKTLDAHGKHNIPIIFGHNADVALDQSEEFWQSIGGIVGIDNYLPNYQEMDNWCQKAKAKFPHTKIVMLEYGAIIDKNNDPHAQALFAVGLLRVMLSNGIDGFNYQTLNQGDTTLLERKVEKTGNQEKVVYDEREAFKAVQFVYQHTA